MSALPTKLDSLGTNWALTSLSLATPYFPRLLQTGHYIWREKAALFAKQKLGRLGSNWALTSLSLTRPYFPRVLQTGRYIWREKAALFVDQKAGVLWVTY